MDNTNIPINLTVSGADDAQAAVQGIADAAQHTTQSVGDMNDSWLTLAKAAKAAGDAGDTALRDKLMLQAAAAKQQVAQLTSQVTLLGSTANKTAALLDFGKTVETGFSAASGALSILTGGSADAAKGIERIHAALKVLEGINAFAQGIEQLNTLRSIIPAVELGFKSLSTASKEALISTGIGALVVALGLVIENWDKIKAAMDGTKPSFEDVIKEQEKTSKAAEAEWDVQKKITEELVKQGKIDKVQANEKNTDILKEQLGFQTQLANQTQKYADEITANQKKNEADKKKDILEGWANLRGVKVEELQMTKELQTYLDKQVAKAGQLSEKEQSVLDRLKEQLIKKKELTEQVNTAEVEHKELSWDKVISAQQQALDLLKAQGEAGANAAYQAELKLLKSKTREAYNIYGEESEQYKAALNAQNVFTTQHYTQLQQKAQENADKIKAINTNLDHALEDIGQNDYIRQRHEAARAYDQTVADGGDKVKAMQLLQKQLDAIDDAETQHDIETQKQKADQDKADADQKLATAKDAYNKELEAAKSAATAQDALDKESKAKGLISDSQLKAKLLQNKKDLYKQELALAQKYKIDVSALLKTQADDDVKNTDDANKKKLASAQSYFKDAQALSGALQNLSDMVYSNEIKNAHGNTARIKELQKEQFETNKKLQIAAATINLAAGIFNVVTSKKNQDLGPIASQIYEAVEIAALVASYGATVAKIASAQFDGGSAGGSSSGVSLATVTANGVTLNPANQYSQTTATANANNATNKYQNPTKVYVTESDITKAQGNVNRIKNQATVH